MTKPNLKRCLCGEVPEEIFVYLGDDFAQPSWAAPSCCEKLRIGFDADGETAVSEKHRSLAYAAWNDAPRGGE